MSLEPTPRGRELASETLLNAVRSHGRSITFAIPGSDELRYLNLFRANANVGGERCQHILLREDARKIELLEEFLHGTQCRAGIFDRYGILEAEKHLKRFMIQHRNLLGIEPDDIAVLESLLGEDDEIDD